jgi:Leucine-rich repeat (LRR) protein
MKNALLIILSVLTAQCCAQEKRNSFVVSIKPTLEEEPSTVAKYCLYNDKKYLSIASHATNQDFDTIVKKIKKSEATQIINAANSFIEFPKIVPISTVICRHNPDITTLAPLSRFSHLETISCHNCSINDITSLSQQKALRDLDISGNNITDVTALIPIINNLKELNISRNPLEKYTVIKLINHIKHHRNKPWLVTIEKHLFRLVLENCTDPVIPTQKKISQEKLNKDALKKKIAANYATVLQENLSTFLNQERTTQEDWFEKE